MSNSEKITFDKMSADFSWMILGKLILEENQD